MKLYSETLMREAKRDIVQFVDFSKNQSNCLVELAMEEIPTQFLMYRKDRINGKSS